MKNIILRYLNNEANSAERDALFDWLSKKSENRCYFMKVYNIWLAARQADNRFDAKRAMQCFIRRIADYEMLASRQHKKRLLYFVGSAAATLLILISLSVFIFHQKPSQEYSTIVVEATQKKKIVLPDQSVVWLSPNSKLSYPEQFAGDKRIVFFEGDALFEIFPNKEKPFMIDMGREIIQVLGTTFNIQRKSEISENEIVLLEGSIELKFLDTYETYQLYPNDKISYSKTRKPMIEAVDASLYSIKANERLIFDNESLSHVISCLEVWYGMKVCLSDVNADKIHVSFTIIDESPEQTMKMLSMVAPVRCEISEGTIHLAPSK